MDLFSFVPFHKNKYVLDLLCLFTFSLFTCRALLISEGGFIAGTDSLSVHLLSEQYLRKVFGNRGYVWSTLYGCGHDVNPPAPIFLVAGLLAVAIDSLFNKLITMATTFIYGNSTILENTSWSPHLFSAKNSSLIFGGLNTIQSLISIDGFELNKWALFFKHQTLSPTLEEYDTVIISEASALIPTTKLQSFYEEVTKV